jgi:putative transposase
MPRLGRYFLPEQPLHVIQRGNNRQAIFLKIGDRPRFSNIADPACRAGRLDVVNGFW